MQKRKSSQSASPKVQPSTIHQRCIRGCLHAPTFRTSCPQVKGSLQGIDGNAFMLMGYFQKLAKQQGFSKEWIQEVLDEAEILTSCQFLHSGVLPSARSKDYDHLVETLLNNMEE